TRVQGVAFDHLQQQKLILRIVRHQLGAPRRGTIPPEARPDVGQHRSFDRDALSRHVDSEGTFEEQPPNRVTGCLHDQYVPRRRSLASKASWYVSRDLRVSAAQVPANIGPELTSPREHTLQLTGLDCRRQSSRAGGSDGGHGSPLPLLSQELTEQRLI